MASSSESLSLVSVKKWSQSSESLSLVSVKKWPETSTSTSTGNERSYLLRLSEEVILIIIQSLAIEDRIRLSSLHSRLKHLVDNSLIDVKKFPENPTKKRLLDPITPIYFNDYFGLILKCPNLTTLHVCHKMRPQCDRSDQEAKLTEESDLKSMGEELALNCPKIQKLVGRFSPLEFVHSFVQTLRAGNDLTEITIHKIESSDDVSKVASILELCPKLTTLRCLIHSNSLTADIRTRIREPSRERGVKLSGSGVFSS